MRTVRIPGGSYVDARLDGCYAGIRGGVIQTHAGDVPAFGAALPFFLRTNDDGPFEFAGQASTDVEGVLVYRGGAWSLDPRIATPNGVIYTPDGALHVWSGGPNLSSQGFRYVAPDGSIVMGDATIFRDGLNEWTDLSDQQDGSILIGQGNASGGVVVKIDGTLRRLHDGPCRAIHARQQAGAVVVAFYVEGDAGYVYWLTLDDLRALPALQLTIPTDPTPDPEIPMPDSLEDAVRAERAKYPTPLVNVNDYATILNTVAWDHRDEGWGLSVKPQGNHVMSPQGVPVAYDILHHKPTNTLWGCFGDAGVNWGLEQYHGDPEGRPWLAPIAPVGGGDDDDPGDDDDDDADPPVCNCAAELAALRKDLQTDLAAIATRVEGLEQRPAPPAGDVFDPALYVARGEVAVKVPIWGEVKKTVTLPIIRKP